MLNTQLEFDRSKQEVDLYFIFLGKIDTEFNLLSELKTGQSYRIDDELVTILKANAFLILYNLVEATIRNGLWDIINSLTIEGIIYKDLLAEIKEVLIKDQLVNRFEYRTSDETITRHVYRIIENVLANSTNIYPNTKRDIKFSGGNLTIETIQNTFKGYGLRSVAVRHDDQKTAFDRTKSNRNKLAHGNNTFRECGRDYSYGDLEETKLEIMDYLQKIIFEIDSFITEKRFLKVL